MSFTLPIPASELTTLEIIQRLLLCEHVATEHNKLQVTMLARALADLLRHLTAARHHAATGSRALANQSLTDAKDAAKWVDEIDRAQAAALVRDSVAATRAQLTRYAVAKVSMLLTCGSCHGTGMLTIHYPGGGTSVDLERDCPHCKASGTVEAAP